MFDKQKTFFSVYGWSVDPWLLVPLSQRKAGLDSGQTWVEIYWARGAKHVVKGPLIRQPILYIAEGYLLFVHDMSQSRSNNCINWLKIHNNMYVIVYKTFNYTVWL